MAHDVFISYSQKDKPTADAACAALEAAGIRSWIAPRDVPAGMSWPAAIVGAIGQCRVMVLVFSSHAIASEEVQREVVNAFQERVVVVPLRIEDVRPSGDMAYYMRTTHWLDAMTPPLAAHLQRLCKTVRALFATLDDGGDTASIAPQFAAAAASMVVGDRSSRPPRQTSRAAIAAKWIQERLQLAAKRIIVAAAVASNSVKSAAKRPRLALLSAIAITLVVCWLLIWSFWPAGTFAGTRAGQKRDDNSLKTKLVWIPPGDFTMGSPKNEKDRFDNEGPVQVSLTKGFWLGQHEVTQAEWQRAMQTTPWSGRDNVKEGGDFPATYVSWFDATEFCKKLSEIERSGGRLPSGWKYSLPTEAQWEYACRAGSRSRFSFGDDESDLGEYAWFAKNATDDAENYAHQVARKKANSWGLYDMHGNVSEWCRDIDVDKLPGGADPEVSDPRHTYRVCRGGCWRMTATYCRSAGRPGNIPSTRGNCVGFRVALVPSGK